MEQQGILFLAVQAGGLGKRKDQKREKLIEERARSWQRTRKHRAGETAGVPDRMQAAQLVWMCDRDPGRRACDSSAYSCVSHFLVFKSFSFHPRALEHADLHFKPMQ